jgi:hypothetical protein
MRVVRQRGSSFASSLDAGGAMFAFAVCLVAVALSAGLMFGPAAGLLASAAVAAAGYAAHQVMRDM